MKTVYAKSNYRIVRKKRQRVFSDKFDYVYYPQRKGLFIWNDVKAIWFDEIGSVLFYSEKEAVKYIKTLL